MTSPRRLLDSIRGGVGGWGRDHLDSFKVSCVFITCECRQRRSENGALWVCLPHGIDIYRMCYLVHRNTVVYLASVDTVESYSSARSGVFLLWLGCHAVLPSVGGQAPQHAPLLSCRRHHCHSVSRSRRKMLPPSTPCCHVCCRSLDAVLANGPLETFLT